MDEPCTRGPSGDGRFEQGSAGQFSLGAYLQQSRIDLEKAASSPWETLKSFLPQSFGALVRQTASRYTSALLFLTLTAVLGLLAGECTDGALLDLVAAGGCGVLLWGSLLEEARNFVSRWRAGAAFCWDSFPSMLVSSRWEGKERQAVRPVERC